MARKSTRNSEEEWSRLQDAYRAANSAWQALIAQLKAKYAWSPTAYLTARTSTEGTREARLYKAQRAASDACYEWLKAYAAPREWGSGVPADWLYGSLTYADATTHGQMSVTPPAAYGASQSQAKAFAEPIPHALHRVTVAGCEPCAIWNRVLKEPVSR
jgi:hypothetical protein